MIQKVLLGTYTRKDSKGIYEIDLDTDKKTLTNLKLVAAENSPTYLTKSLANNLYSVTTVQEKGGASAYDPQNNFINAVTEDGAPLCYVAVDEKRQLLYGSNYHKGELNSYKIEKDGSLTAADHVFHQEAVGPHQNQDHAHVHYSDLAPDGRLVVCDLGTDGVYTYDVTDDGKFSLVSLFKAEPGTGPRHLVFHPTLSIAYLFGELNNTVRVLTYENGVFTEIESLSTLPADFNGDSSGAAIRISQDGHFLYTSNRGHDSIAVMTIDPNGKNLATIQIISSEGAIPRDFNLDPTDEFLVCGHQNSDNLTLFSRDKNTGLLSLLEKDVYAPEVVCVYFD
ncbi:lactonase family protein [Enterococcus sp. AZ103]|uniref:lactonase family protein n=1 Tax=Enterococcus sp. AZ103 TaxID=2774628 RepID=UPI003F20610A